MWCKTSDHLLKRDVMPWNYHPVHGGKMWAHGLRWFSRCLRQIFLHSSLQIFVYKQYKIAIMDIEVVNYNNLRFFVTLRITWDRYSKSSIKNSSLYKRYTMQTNCVENLTTAATNYFLCLIREGEFWCREGHGKDKYKFQDTGEIYYAPHCIARSGGWRKF